MIGQALAHYRIVREIGTGGMGVVYEAEDTTLGRRVALKVLPPEVSGDQARRSRFAREARAVAALNHPNIVTLHSIEESDGIHFITMELVEGRSLADLLPGGGLPLDRFFDVAVPLVDAVAAAHQQGITHRDLKPANLMIGADGRLKVLDFGLARAESQAAGDVSHVTVSATQDGLIVGTPAYMSPEQARGETVDARSDIFSLGIVFYEMLTGQRPFEGDNPASVISAILRDAPRSVNERQPSVPRPLARLVNRCLLKNPRERFQSAIDLGHSLGEAKEDVDSGDAFAAAMLATPVPRAHGTRRATLGALGPVAMSVIAATAIVVAVLARRERSAPGAGVLGPLIRLTSDSGLTTEPSISADGRLVAYASNRTGEGNLDVYVQQTSGSAAIRLTNDAADDREPTVSPDGSLVAFRSDRVPAGIYVSPALGGSARLIAPEGRGPRFSPDGRFIAYWTGAWLAPRSVNVTREVFIVAATGGTPERVALDVVGSGDPVWAPDGQSLLVFGRGATNEPDWWWVPRGGGASLKTGAYGRFAAQRLNISTTDLFPIPQAWGDRGVLFSAADGIGDARGVWRIGIDPKSGRVTGDAVRLTHGTTSDVWPSASNDNRMVFAAQTLTQLIFGLPIDVNAGTVTGPMGRLRDDTATTGRASLSEDGRLMVFPKYVFASGGVWARDLTTGREWELAAAPRTPLNPVITVDGKWTAYTVTKVDTGGNGGPGDGYVVQTSGGAPRRVCENCRVSQWTRDGRSVLIGDEERRISRLDVSDGHRTPLLDGNDNIDRLLFGPDNRWMTFNTPGHVYVAPVHADRASPKEEWTSIVATTSGGRTAGLSPDGKLLYVLLETDGFRCLYGLRLDPETGQSRGTPFLIAHFHDAARAWGSTGMGSAAVKGLFVADLVETTSNIWMASFAESQP